MYKLVCRLYADIASKIIFIAMDNGGIMLLLLLNVMERKIRNVRIRNKDANLQQIKNLTGQMTSQVNS